ncbi:hypothetical protein [Flavobacterium chilense]|uniref:YD repeat-containing protein n=1 Tax=Flavobacterium chilense TaxID=946677 RepID=A0A1M7F6C0_9FLAO|nr:hypothetical protein [Flavobacterium chilense]SHL99259.1 hypothetical protein SAMN05444484_103233 [Flavobacterium chilense]
MNKIYLNILLLFFFTYCKNDEASIIKKHALTTDILHPVYLISQMTIKDQEAKREEIIKYKYDSLNRITEVQLGISTVYNSYDKNNKLTKKKHIFKEYNYFNTQDSLVYSDQEVKIFSTGNNKYSLPKIYKLKLNSSGLVSEMQADKLTSVSNEYDNDHNLKTERSYKNGKCIKTNFQYDNKHSPFINIIGHDPRIIPQKNNIIKETIYDCNSNDVKNIITYTYEYNNDGYPTQKKEKRDTKEIITTYQYIIK